jgi:hypothetical protein
MLPMRPLARSCAPAPPTVNSHRARLLLDLYFGLLELRFRSTLVGRQQLLQLWRPSGLDTACFNAGDGVLLLLPVLL